MSEPNPELWDDIIDRRLAEAEPGSAERSALGAPIDAAAVPPGEVARLAFERRESNLAAPVSSAAREPWKMSLADLEGDEHAQARRFLRRRNRRRGASRAVWVFLLALAVIVTLMGLDFTLGGGGVPELDLREEPFSLPDRMVEPVILEAPRPGGAVHPGD